MLDTDALEANTTCEGNYEATLRVVQRLWSFVRNALEETKIQFLRFCTGDAWALIDRLGQLPFKVQQNEENMLQLLAAHTYFNMLLLLEYGDNCKRMEECLLAEQFWIARDLVWSE